MKIISEDHKIRLKGYNNKYICYGKYIPFGAVGGTGVGAGLKQSSEELAVRQSPGEKNPK